MTELCRSDPKKHAMLQLHFPFHFLSFLMCFLLHHRNYLMENEETAIKIWIIGRIPAFFQQITQIMQLIIFITIFKILRKNKFLTHIFTFLCYTSWKWSMYILFLFLFWGTEEYLSATDALSWKAEHCTGPRLYVVASCVWVTEETK